MFSIDGIVSGFDSTSIIESLLGFQQTQIDTFNSRKSEIAVQQSAFKSIEAQMLTMQGAISKLNRATNSVFDVQNATSSDNDILTATAGNGAANGVYSLTVNALATAHQLGSQGISSTTSEVATGDYTIQVGDGETTTITIDSTNNSLNGFVNAINEQSDDVSAGIIFDQGADSYRILLTANETGADNTISISNNADSNTGIIPDFSGQAVQEASNAVVTLGSGAGAITAEYSSNQIEDLIENVTIDLTSADATKSVSISVTSDTTAAQTAIEEFVGSFNALMDFIEDQTRFVPETNNASPLLGNRNVSDIQNELRAFVTNTVPGLANGQNRLSAIGVDINLNGKLTVDSSQLQKALSGQLEGVDPSEIRNLFGLNATSDNEGVQFIAGGRRTQSSVDPYDVTITQAATQASIASPLALEDRLTVTESDNDFQITLNGNVSEVLEIAPGAYTSEELATAIQSAINASSELGVNDVQVTVDSKNAIVVTSETYGSRSSVSSFYGSLASTIGFAGTENSIGKDVEGYFTVNGEIEAADGSGRVLTGDQDNEFTADLQLRVSLSEAEVAAGETASVLVTRGVTGSLDQYLDRVLDTESGTLKNINDDFDARIQSIDESIERVQEITESKREYLIAEFTALESIINELQTTGSFLSSQLQTIQPPSNNN